MVMQIKYNENDDKLTDLDDDKSQASVDDIGSDVDDADADDADDADYVDKEDILETNEEDIAVDVDDVDEVDEEEPDEDDDDDDDDTSEKDDDSRADGVFRNNTSNNNDTDVLDLDDDLYDSDEDFDNYEKFQSNTSREITQQHYPELISHNYEEIDKLSKVIRDKSGAIADPFHRTLPFLSRYERARVIGERAKQLENGAMSFVELEPHEIDSYMIAMKEFQNKKIPFIIKRPLPNGASEYWKLSDLEVL
jgi:DNA-directed RNA polymerase subunit K/omega